MAVAEARGARTYGNWRRPTSAGLGELGSLGTAVLLLGLIAVIVTMMLVGFVAATAVGVCLAVFLGGLRSPTARRWSTRSRSTPGCRSGGVAGLPR